MLYWNESKQLGQTRHASDTYLLPPVMMAVRFGLVLFWCRASVRMARDSRHVRAPESHVDRQNGAGRVASDNNHKKFCTGI
jgi:hypothetical protein